QRRVVEGTRDDRAVERDDRGLELFRSETEPQREIAYRSGLFRGKHRRHELPERLRVDDAVADLSWLLRDEPPPNRITLRPEILALIVEAIAVAVDDYSE